MYCQNCGAMLPENANVCPNCGAPVNNKTTSNKQTSFNNQNTYSNTNSTPNQVSPKSRLITFLLAFFIGMFGVHNFYLGKTSKGITQLILTLICITAPITAVWSVIEWIMCLCGSLTDNDGLLVLDWDIK